MRNISSYMGGREEEESVTAYFQPSIIPATLKSLFFIFYLIFSSITFQFPPCVEKFQKEVYKIRDTFRDTGRPL